MSFLQGEVNHSGRKSQMIWLTTDLANSSCPVNSEDHVCPGKDTSIEGNRSLRLFVERVSSKAEQWPAINLDSPVSNGSLVHVTQYQPQFKASPIYCSLALLPFLVQIAQGFPIKFTHCPVSTQLSRCLSLSASHTNTT